jgi:hypothetical protein
VSRQSVMEEKVEEWLEELFVEEWGVFLMYYFILTEAVKVA